MQQMIYVVYYAGEDDQVQLLRAFSSPKRAQEYVTMLKQAPFPNQLASGYHFAPIQLN